MKLWKVKNKRNPYATSVVGDCSFVVGAEASNAITISGQVKDIVGADMTVRSCLTAYLSSDANGDTLAASPEGLAAGTDGTVLARGDAGTNELIRKATLAIHSTPEQFATTSIAAYRIAGVVYTKAVTAALTFTLGHIIAASKFGVILVQINTAGTISTKVPATTQSYNSAPLALAALPSPDAGNISLGYIAIANDAGAWTANTDDLTNGSDLTTAAFVDSAEATTVPRIFDIVTEADGDFDIVITDTRAPKTYRLNVVLPDGTLKTSGAATFA